MDEKYDYIISGAGCAGLSLLMRMISSEKFSGKKILLVDKAEKKSNDRTWCFWEKGTGFFEPIVHCHWQKLWFHSSNYSALKQIQPYTYKMIRGVDFYNHCFNIIHQQKNITVLIANVEKAESNAAETFVCINGEKIAADYIFNSIIFEKPIPGKKHFYLFQHFKGWVIKTDKKVFNPEEAVLMDFRVSQQHGTSFAYMMPLSDTKALVEYTLFTEKILSQHEYDAALKNYLHHFFQLEGYTVTEEEFGVIPMTNYDFPARDHNIINIGTAGGMTKGSSGYTFQFIQKQSDGIISALLKPGALFFELKKERFHFYDSVLLNVLATGKLPGDEIFTNMFSKNNAIDIFNFLDNESNFFQEMKIIKSFPHSPFLRAAWQQLF